MEEIAESLGAVIGKSVSRDAWLVTGERVGSVKINKAREVNAKVITEDEFNKLIADY